MNKKSEFLPDFLSEESMQEWLRSSAKEKSTDERKHYYSEEEINEMSKESCVSGGEILSLEDILKQVKDFIENGSEETVAIEIPMTAGAKALKEARKQRDLKVRKGFESVEQTVYGVVDDERETMRYFNEFGAEIFERERSLSAKEKRDYLGLFMSVTSKTGTDN